MLTRAPRNVWKLRLFQDARYTDLLDKWERALIEVAGHKVSRVKTLGCVELSSHWKHWICLFPQHGAGPKHLRSIELEEWQRRLVEQFPHQFVKGLLDSDGCRATNRVKSRAGKYYQYPRYFFSNRSAEIQELFMYGCWLIGVECRRNNRWNISVAKRASVALLDEFVGPKR